MTSVLGPPSLLGERSIFALSSPTFTRPVPQKASLNCQFLCLPRARRHEAGSSTRIQCQRKAITSEPTTNDDAMCRRHALASFGMITLPTILGEIFCSQATAAGLESVPIPTPDIPNVVQKLQERNKATLDAAEEKFQESDLLRTLKERSEANREANKKKLQDVYCRRQAELGVGDCAGLRLIPGATRSGVQKRPEILDKIAKKFSGEE